MNRDIMNKGGFGAWVDKVKSGNCPVCNSPVNTDEFKDELSIKEYQITGMCQQCQDKFFNEEADQEDDNDTLEAR